MKILAMVLAGGQGSRLHPLTAERSKPAVPFGSRYRIADFVLSSLVNSGIRSIYLLVQYKSQSMIEHVNKAWGHSRSFSGDFVTVVPPQMREGQEWFHGTADAIHQNINLIEHHAPDKVAVFGADHIYRMDVRQMAAFHDASHAHVSVAAIPVPLAEARSFGVIEQDSGGRIARFHEKPAFSPAMPCDPARALGSMGNYLFDTDVLLAALREARQRGETDFGMHILPRLIHSHRVYAYDFSNNRIPGIRDNEELAYWRDVGTLDAYYAANMDLLGSVPRLNLFNPQWFINSSNYQGPSPRIHNAQIESSTIGAGSLIAGARLKNTLLRREVVIEEDVEIEDSIIMDYVVIRRGARLRKVVIDRYNEIPPGTRIGFDQQADRARYDMSDGGIAILRKGLDRPSTMHYAI